MKEDEGSIFGKAPTNDWENFAYIFGWIWAKQGVGEQVWFVSNPFGGKGVGFWGKSQRQENYKMFPLF